ncbi:hypothetical protein ACHAXT_010812 [Thalassiosira profunda]
MSAANASVLQFLDEECEDARNPEHAAQTERYFKGIHPFYGIKSPALRPMIKKVQAQHGREWTAESLLSTTESLLEAPHGEKKMLGVYLLGVPANLKQIEEEPRVIDTLGGFIERYVQDWATCDGLSSQVVRKLIERNPDYAPEVQAWCQSPNDWKQRSSCVSFVCLARHGNYNGVIFDIATNVVRNPKRFPQLGAGWVLRELSLADEPAVIDFIKEHYEDFSREGLRYAIEKMDKPLQKQLLSYGRRASMRAAGSESISAMALQMQQ